MKLILIPFLKQVESHESWQDHLYTYSYYIYTIIINIHYIYIYIIILYYTYIDLYRLLYWLIIGSISIFRPDFPQIAPVAGDLGPHTTWRSQR